MRSYIGPILFLVILIVFFYLPISFFFTGGLAAQSDIISEPAYWRIIGKTILYSAIASLLCTVVATPIALRISFKARQGLSKSWVISLLPMAVNPLAIIFGWIFLLREDGIVTRLMKSLGGTSVLYTQAAIVIGMVYIGIPMMTFFLTNAMRNIDKKLLVASGVMGAKNWYTFFKVVLPLSHSGYVSGFLFVFLSSCGYFIVPSLLGGGKVSFISSIIDQVANKLLDWNAAAQLSLMLLLMIAVIIFLVVSIIRKKLPKNV